MQLTCFEAVADAGQEHGDGQCKYAAPGEIHRRNEVPLWRIVRCPIGKITGKQWIFFIEVANCSLRRNWRPRIHREIRRLFPCFTSIQTGQFKRMLLVIVASTATARFDTFFGLWSSGLIGLLTNLS